MAKLPEWKGDDAQRLRSFITENPKFLTHLRARMPRAGVADTTEKAANHGQITEGFLMALDAIAELSEGDAGGLKPSTPYIHETKREL